MHKIYKTIYCYTPVHNIKQHFVAPGKVSNNSMIQSINIYTCISNKHHLTG